MQAIKVWISKRKTKKGQSYHLRYISPISNKWISKGVGSDKKRADREAALLESKLNDGTYSETRRISWDEFVKGQVASITGKCHKSLCKQVLDEFGKVCKPASPSRVTFPMIEQFVAASKLKKNAVTTINTKLKYLRLSFNMAVKRSYIVKNPMDGWIWEKPNLKEPREVTKDEQKALLDAAQELYGDQWELFVKLAFDTGARRGELLKLSWENVDFDGHSILFVETKGKKDRRVPVNPKLFTGLRKLQAKTLLDGKPFGSLLDNIGYNWRRIRKEAGCEDVTIHDMRRTYCTRMLRAGVPLKTVQQLSGHESVETLLTYYTSVSEDDKREAVRKMTAMYG